MIRTLLAVLAAMIPGGWAFACYTIDAVPHGTDSYITPPFLLFQEDGLLPITGLDGNDANFVIRTMADNASGATEYEGTADIESFTCGTYSAPTADTDIGLDECGASSGIYQLAIRNSVLDTASARKIFVSFEDNGTTMLDTCFIIDLTAIDGTTVEEAAVDWADGGRLDLILDARASQASVTTLQADVTAAATQIVAGTAESGTTASFVDSTSLTAFTAAEDLINRYVVREDGQGGYVTDYDPMTGEVTFATSTFASAWSTQTYKIYPRGEQ